MAHNDWLDFPEFDVARWEADTSTMDASEGGTWDKPCWSPSVQSEELPAKAIAPKTAGNAWSLTETIHRAADVLSALMGGAEGIRLQHEAVSDEWLNEVHLNMIQLHLDADRIDLTRFSVDRLLTDGWQGSCTRSVRGLTAEAANLHADALKAAPMIRKWTIDTCGEMAPVEALTSGLMQAQNALEVFKTAGVDAAEAVRAFSWAHTVGPHVLEGVAMTRAMRLLWQRWLDWQGLGQASIWLDARTYIPSVGEGLSTDRLIGMTSAAYVSAVGGCDALEVVPHDADDQHGSADGRRWARNVQHLMREEAGLHRVFDPMGGSRVVESWTASLVATVWEAFENRTAS